ncbi:hypothetical protein RP20_CCG013730 [Aedes albopictus]|nr:hypothetical protein RP20_CCG013730 [Aedes albopictus]
MDQYRPLLGVFLLTFLVGQAIGSPTELIGLVPQFVEFLGSQSSTWNFTNSSTAEWDRPCVNQLELFVKQLQNNAAWAVNMYDSWGKVPTGVFFGNIYEFGNFDQCRRVQYSHYYGKIGGQHCTMMVNVQGLQLPLPPIWYSICVPDVCQPRMVSELVNSFLQNYGMQIVNNLDTFCYKDEEHNFSALTITAIVLFSCYGAFLVVVTLSHIVLIYADKAPPSFINRFSAYTNLLKITATAPQSQTKTESMDCVNGIRALSMIWIIINHVHDAALGLPTTNTVIRTEYTNSYYGVLFHRLGGKAVDIFLMLSGMLVAMKLLRELDRNRKLNLAELYLHRYIRITPAYAAMILFALAFVNHLGEGVLYKLLAEDVFNACSTSWWSALLYVQNYVHHPQMCFPHTWYLSVDMQLYFLSPLILFPLWKYGKRFVPAVVFLALLSIACVFSTFMVNGYRLNKSAPVGDGLWPRKTYHATHARMSVWLFGVLFGYFLHRTKSRTIRLPKRARVLGWVLAAGMLVLTCYSLKQVYVGDYDRFSVVVDAFYESLHRSFWAFGVMWLIFICVNGQGGLVNEFLSWRFWQPMAKLSYTMYLLHIMIQAVTVTMHLKSPLYFSAMDLIYRIFGLVGVSAVAGGIWSIAFEYPFFGLEKKLFKRKTAM